MAAAAYPILRLMIKQHLKSSTPSDPLPARSFIYGIHWSMEKVRILAHFPWYNKKSVQWEFRQAVLAEHWTGIQTTSERQADIGPCLDADMMLLGRWRLSIALLTVASHVDNLEQWLRPNAIASRKSGRAASQHHTITPPLTTYMLSVAEVQCGSSYQKHLRKFRSTWNDQIYRIPGDWIVRHSFSLS